MNIRVPQQRIEAFCHRWKISELALFGSVLTSEFRPDSDVDVLVTFAPDAEHSLFDRVAMIEELKQIFGRNVDLVRKDGLSNPFRREHILSNHQVLYAA